ncbi:polysaccharide export outer membrane protein [Bacteroidia bacterium]|nr:polysaccharide export outer membrane protein [Bacteroidia bacterium]GHT61930.1 polysaccharide export outer membrane protein [Bacteroidia bacterium]GHU81075.1 polysaccharide export outer membrane protein [Bacteroidia bacterium]
MKLNIKVFSLLLLFCAASCTSYKKVPYFQVNGDPTEFETPSYASRSVVRFQPDDVLAITVNVIGDQKIAADYNLPLQPSATTFEGEGAVIDQGTGRQTYLVSKNGDIDFPTLGLIKAAGYTQEELQDYIKQLLRGRMKVDPVVTVRMMNFKIMVTGEVNRPGQITVNKDRIDLFEAIALAGDLTIFGKRDDVFIRRQMPDGTFKYVKLDISKADVTASPYFYLRQNDVVYVQPSRAKTLQSDISLWNTVMSIATFLVTMAVFIRR